jgi:spore coat polysaccharide biosynthesis protein SpsF
MKIVATIQARMGSTRLPGKVLLEAGGKPFLLRQVERIKQSKFIDHIIVATSTESGDDEIVRLCQENKIDVFRGSENDVLGRVSQSLLPYRGWVHAEFVGDSPFIDPGVIDEVIGYYLRNITDIDYVSNGLEPTYPNGCEFNVYDVNTLLECNDRVAFDNLLREHVDIHIYKSSRYRSVNLKAPEFLNRPDLYIELDTKKDFDVLKSIADHFEKIGKDDFSLGDIIAFLNENPAIANLNSSEYRKYWEIKGMPGE